MFGIRFLKARPTTHVLHYRDGRLRREGAGLSFLYYAPTSVIVSIPLQSTEIPFAFSEITSDFQEVTLQGQITYRVADPHRLAALLDYSIDPRGTYHSDDPQKLDQRLVRRAQALARDVVQRLPLADAITSADAVAAQVLDGLRAANDVVMLGVEILSLSVVSIRPSPDVARALEAEAREAINRRADQAVYDRRNNAVEQERRIKESELQTELAVEEKKRQVRETQMAADIAVEEQRSALVERRADNDRKEADARAYSLRATLEPVREMDWKTLSALATGGGDPRLAISLAFRELAENAQKIGELNVSPELLTGLLAKQ